MPRSFVAHKIVTLFFLIDRSLQVDAIYGRLVPNMAHRRRKGKTTLDAQQASSLRGIAVKRFFYHFFQSCCQLRFILRTGAVPPALPPEP
jgi:hypothetical protein